MTDATENRKDHESRERIAVLESQMSAMLEQHKQMAIDIRAILNTLAEARGGWRLMVAVGGAGGLLGAIIGKWFSIIINAVPK